MRSLGLALVLLALALGVGGCSSDDSSGSSSGGTGASGGSTSGGGSGGATGGGSGSGATGGIAGSGGAAGAGGGSLGSAVRFGINGGYPNPAWNDTILADLEVAAGANSQRLSLPESHLSKWGFDAEVSDMQYYASAGLKDQVVFLTNPIREHSTAPSTAPDSELVNYIPKNLYQPITLASGQVNPENYWAKYVYDTVAKYKTWVRVWEIWNEPDWVSDWSVTGSWASSPPLAKDLPRFNGSIYDYVRMLRVSSVAAKLADPNAKIATGGIGYTTFLSAILRYTDNPTDGSVTSEYPSKGGSYIDVVSFHYYPIYTPGGSEAGVKGFEDQKALYEAELAKANATVGGWEVTETGAPRVSLSNVPSGPDYAKNYLLKVMVVAPSIGVHGVDWFVLADAAKPGSSTDPYAFMGLYQDVTGLTQPSDAVLTDTGRAYATLGALLGGAKYDAARTQSLGLPANARGVAFQTASGKEALVLWATSGSDESAATTVDLAISGTMLAHDWDYSKTATTSELLPSGGKVSIALTATPRILIRK